MSGSAPPKDSGRDVPAVPDPSLAFTTSLQRLRKEQAYLKLVKPSYIQEVELENGNQHIWTVVLLPPRPPYNKGAFRVRITFPNDYPFKPPFLQFITPIYHPNIDEKGLSCLPILQYDNWKPSTTIQNVLQSLIFLLNDPEPERPLRQQIAEEIYKDKQKFIEAAIQHTSKNAEKRPPNV